MIFRDTQLAGACLITPELQADERGFFARTFCRHEFAAHGLNVSVAQCNLSYNHRRGTLRGLHFQKAPATEAKLVRCVRGAVYDVMVDLRTDSPTFARWFAAELSAENRAMMYVPEGFAHGFQTLTDAAELVYQMSRDYQPEYAAGVRWDDPQLAIAWPLTDPVISPRDQSLPLLEQLFAGR